MRSPIQYHLSTHTGNPNAPVLHNSGQTMCDRITSLWQVPNLPASVRHLLTTFYQQRLDFSQEDLNVLAAIYSCVKPSLAIDLTEEKEDDHTSTQNKIKAAGVDNQIASIITSTE